MVTVNKISEDGVLSVKRNVERLGDGHSAISAESQQCRKELFNQSVVNLVVQNHHCPALHIHRPDKLTAASIPRT